MVLVSHGRTCWTGSAYRRPCLANVCVVTPTFPPFVRPWAVAIRVTTLCNNILMLCCNIVDIIVFERVCSKKRCINILVALTWLEQPVAIIVCLLVRGTRITR